MIDHVITTLDGALRTLFASAHAARAVPGSMHASDAPLNDPDRHIAGRLMRINHVGEICAQALYQGQALTARSAHVREAMQYAAREEQDHLAWCEQRINELGGRKSLLNPLWYAGSFAFGAVSGLLGDKWNLAFLAETERQVEGHLDDHLQKLPATDTRSRAILEQMQRDEAQHAATATALGAADMPRAVSEAMRLASRVMTSTAYWV
jgi:3-demethoxyubiquinol 3-hydroxylase